MMDAGTHANGGIGRRISNGGKNISRKYLLTASASPNGMPTICAIINPRKTLKKLKYQLSQYPGRCTTIIQRSKTAVGGANFPIHQISMPNQFLNWAPISQNTMNPTIARTPRQRVLFDKTRRMADRFSEVLLSF